MEQVKQFIGIDGRVSRSAFWINLLILGTASFVLSLWCVQRYVSFYDFQEHTYITHKPIYFTAMILIGLRIASVSVRRWHDLGRSGWFAALNIFVFANSIEVVDLSDGVVQAGLLLSVVILLVILGFQGFVPGSQAPNEYGLPGSGLATREPEEETYVLPSRFSGQ